MTITLYDLAGAEKDRRFSPYCWRTRMALAHKGLAVETIPWAFTDKDAIAFSGQGRVPVIRDGERVVSDSGAIADYLETRYPDRPSLFGGEIARGLTRFVASWTESVVHAGLIRFLVLDILNHVQPQDREYFRSSREERLGMTLEDCVKDREAHLPAFRASLAPLRHTVRHQGFLAGAAPAYADYIVFGAFQWARAISDFELLAADDPVALWRSRMLECCGGLARRAPAYGA
jgi:glutathione S-transferase